MGIVFLDEVFKIDYNCQPSDEVNAKLLCVNPAFSTQEGLALVSWVSNYPQKHIVWDKVLD